MAIPAPTPDIEAQREQFKQVRRCYEALIAKGFDLDTLSIGMSDDYPIAIEQGATIVRIGAAIFGARQKQSTYLNWYMFKLIHSNYIDITALDQYDNHNH